MRRFYLYLIFSLAVALPWLNGCIKENRDDCKGRVMLRFRYVGDGTTDIFPEKIEKVTMYVYSAVDESFVGMVEYDKSALTAYQGADIHLFPGRYEIVCWGNVLENSKVREGKHVAAPEYFSGQDIPTNDPLYYGRVEVEVPETLDEWDYLCDFVSSHVKMRVRLEGFNNAVLPIPGLEEDASLSLAMTQLSAHVNFDNIPSQTEICTYYPELTIDPDDPASYVASYNTLRFEDDNDIMIQVHLGTRALVHEFSLADFLREHEIPVEGVHEAEVSILIRAGLSGIEVQDWEREEVTPGFE